jgi:hypothetical protein
MSVDSANAMFTRTEIEAARLQVDILRRLGRPVDRRLSAVASAVPATPDAPNARATDQPFGGAVPSRPANLDEASQRRSARVAVEASARLERALEILGNDAPEHLLSAGRLRLQYPQAALEELGRWADPPMTREAVAGRIRRLLAMADKRATDLGIPDTEDGVTVSWGGGAS